jgi:hypothetical protein
MVTVADHIGVELSPSQLADAEEHGRWKYERWLARPYGALTAETCIHGIIGQDAVALYRGVPMVRRSNEADLNAPDDVDGLQVRCRSKADYGLNLKAKDQGRFILALAHDLPVVWLVGGMTASEGLAVGTPMYHKGQGDHDRASWYLVDQKLLHPLRERPGFSRRGEDGWLVDPQSPGWCDCCHEMHPIIEHRVCRAQAAMRD